MPVSANIRRDRDRDLRLTDRVELACFPMATWRSGELAAFGSVNQVSLLGALFWLRNTLIDIIELAREAVKTQLLPGPG